MNRSFCTLFDKNYLYQGVALYKSLVCYAGDFKLYVLCMDQIAYETLSNMNLTNLILISVEDILTSQLDDARKRTTHGQFCWVCQPIICQYILDKFQVDIVTYLEADSLFFSSPEPLFDELGSKSVTLVPHNYSAEFNNSAVAGKFCVQFNAFRNDKNAREVLSYWIECCLQYDKTLPYDYPGQKSLDDWPNRFDCVVVIEHIGAGVAPWNIRGFKLTLNDSNIYVDDSLVIFFHYHQYGRTCNGSHELGVYPMSRDVIDCFYLPYVNALRNAEQMVVKFNPTFNFHRTYDDGIMFKDLVRKFSSKSLIEYLRTLKRKLRGRYNVYPDAYFSDQSGSARGNS